MRILVFESVRMLSCKQGKVGKKYRCSRYTTLLGNHSYCPTIYNFSRRQLSSQASFEVSFYCDALVLSTGKEIFVLTLSSAHIAVRCIYNAPCRFHYVRRAEYLLVPLQRLFSPALRRRRII